MKFKVFVDGREGTTGLKIDERLSNRDDIELLKIDSDKRKDIETKKVFLNEADIVFLCLPDDASRESVSLVTNEKTKIIDASTAFRVDPNWTYGLPEISKAQREAIKNSKRVANPGCHAAGFTLAIHPLIEKGIVAKNYPVTSHSITGYTGGGKSLINQYEDVDLRKENYASPRIYGLGLKHKHLPEMQKVNGLEYPPLFTPILGAFPQGMLVSVPLLKRQLSKNVSAKDIHEIMQEYYAGERFVTVLPFNGEGYLDNGFLDAMACNNSNHAQVSVFGHDEQILVVTRLDNLGKGASGTAVQNMNIMLGLDEGIGLE